MKNKWKPIKNTKFYDPDASKTVCISSKDLRSLRSILKQGVKLVAKEDSVRIDLWEWTIKAKKILGEE